MKTTDPMVWRCFSQVRDMVANDNMTPFMTAQTAREVERWAASRASEPAFAAVVFQAAVTAQQMRRSARC